MPLSGETYPASPREQRAHASAPINFDDPRYRIRGFLTTAAQHDLDQFYVMLDIFLGHVWVPDRRHLTTTPAHLITDR
jgi:hypothetical protein